MTSSLITTEVDATAATTTTTTATQSMLLLSSSLQSLFTDGRHSITTFLNVTEWLQTTRTCRAWYSTIESTPLRRMSNERDTSLVIKACRLLLATLHNPALPAKQEKPLPQPLPDRYAELALDPSPLVPIAPPPPSFGSRIKSFFSSSKSSSSSSSTFSIPAAAAPLPCAHVLRHIVSVSISANLFGISNIRLNDIKHLLDHLPSIEMLMLVVKLDQLDAKDFAEFMKNDQLVFGRGAPQKLRTLVLTLTAVGDQQFVQANSFLHSQLTQCTSLTTLTLRSPPLELDLSPLTQLKMLTSVELSNYAQECIRNIIRKDRPIQVSYAAAMAKKLALSHRLFRNQMRQLSHVVSMTHLEVNDFGTWTTELFCKHVVCEAKDSIMFLQLHSFSFGSGVLQPGALATLQPIMPNLRILNVQEVRMNELNILPKFIHLESISLKSGARGGNDVLQTREVCRAVSYLESLTHLEITNWSPESIEEWCLIFVGCSHLTSLSCINTGNMDLLLHLTQQQVDGIRMCEHLQHLRLERTSLSHLDLLSYFTSLTQLILGNDAFYNGDAIDDHIDLRRHFDDAILLPQLNRIEFIEGDKSVFIFDREKRIGVDIYRKRKGTAPSRLQSDPPASRLVGIELNPGPQYHR